MQGVANRNKHSVLTVNTVFSECRKMYVYILNPVHNFRFTMVKHIFMGVGANITVGLGMTGMKIEVYKYILLFYLSSLYSSTAESIIFFLNIY